MGSLSSDYPFFMDDFWEILIPFLTKQYPILICINLFLIGYIGIPTKSNTDPQDFDLKNYIQVALLKLTLVNLIFIPVVIFSFILCKDMTYFSEKSSALFNLFLWLYKKYSLSFISSWLLGLVLSFLYSRHFKAKFSSFKRDLKVRQSGDELSDIRLEKERLKSKNFTPETYYKPDNIFLGLDEKNEPIYIKIGTWKKQNQKIIGPTQTGKGVIIGVQLDQAIKQGFCTIYIDPKPDNFIPHIMYQACQESNRNFIYLDFNDQNSLKWGPFINGTPRDRRSRLITALGLIDTGDPSDYYKANERNLIDSVFSQWDGSLTALKSILSHEAYQKKSQKILSYLNEFLEIKSFDCEKEESFSIQESIQKNDVIYVKGSLTDSVVINGCTLFIMEAIQSIINSFPERKNHVFLAIDEVKFMVSDLLAKGLATVIGFDAHILLAYQAISDIECINNVNLNAKAIAQSININCKTTLCYQAVDFETATWASELSGVIQKNVTGMEKVAVDRGAEIWDETRFIQQKPENVITTNRMQMLPERVGILFQPEELPVTIFTCWVSVMKKFGLGKPSTDLSSKFTDFKKIEIQDNHPDIPKINVDASKAWDY